MPALSKESQALLDLLNATPSGGYLSFEDMEAYSDLTMDLNGRSRLYYLLRKINRPWLADRARGIELAGVENAPDIAKVSTDRLDHRIVRTHTVITQMMEYAPALSKQDREALIFGISLTGAIMGVRQAFAHRTGKPQALNTIPTMQLPHLPPTD